MEGIFRRPISRRTALKAGAAGLLASEMALLDQLASTPARLAMAATSLPDIQIAIGNFIPPQFPVNGVMVRFGPVFTFFTPARLTRNPTRADQKVLADALNTIEANFAFSPSGVFTFVAYGLPYFNRIPQAIVRATNGNGIPRLRSNSKRLALEEAIVFPTDFVKGTTDVDRVKKTFNVPVRIERNDVLFTFRSDSMANLTGVLAWLEGSNSLAGKSVPSPALNGLLSFQASRLMFQQIGLPRKVADTFGLPFADRINPQSPMWMGFFDQQVDSSGPAEICTFVGNASHRETNADAGDYFDNGGIQVLSHDILDLPQFYALPSEAPPDGEPFTERVQYMFRSNQLGTVHGIPSEGNADQFKDGGGPSALNNVFQGTDTALRDARDSRGLFAPGNQNLDATFTGKGRIGHEQALQRSSRAADGTPAHIRMDGTGFDSLDVPSGLNTPKLEFTVFVPSAEFFRAFRTNSAAVDLRRQFNVDTDDNGLERFMTATRRQNFLVPPRRHRAFPLLELT